MFWKRNHHVSVLFVREKCMLVRMNIMPYCTFHRWFNFFVWYFLSQGIYTILITCMCVPMFLLKSRFLQQNRNRPYSYIDQIFANCFERPKLSSVEKTEDERVVQVPNVYPKTNTKRGEVHQSVLRSRVVYKYCYNLHFLYWFLHYIIWYCKIIWIISVVNHIHMTRNSIESLTIH